MFYRVGMAVERVLRSLVPWAVGEHRTLGEGAVSSRALGSCG